MDRCRLINSPGFKVALIITFEALSGYTEFQHEFIVGVVERDIGQRVYRDGVQGFADRRGDILSVASGFRPVASLSLLYLRFAQSNQAP